MAVDVVVYDKVDKESEKIQDALYALYPQATITDAAIVSFADGSDGIPVKELVAGVEPVQDLHGQDAPYPPGGGKNKFPITMTTQTKNGTTFTVAEDGTITVSGTPSEITRISLNSLSITPTEVMKFSMVESATDVRVFCKKTSSGTSSYPTISPNASFNVGNTYDAFLLEVGTTFTGTVTLKMQLEAGSTITSWSPYSNICPISGWTGAEIEGAGKNLARLESIGTYNINTGEKNPSAISTYAFTGKFRVGNFSSLTVSCDTTLTQLIVLYWNKAGRYLGYSLPTVPSSGAKQVVASNQYGEETEYVVIQPRQASEITAVESFENFQIEYGSTATAYEPFQSKEISVTFPSSAGTVYGATLTIRPDRTGSLVVDRAKLAITSSINIETFNNATSGNGINITAALPTAMNKASGICTHTVIGKYLSTINNMVLGSNNRYIYWTSILDVLGISTVAEFKSWLDTQTVEVVYNLATPITYTLTESEISGILETLYGTNNIWADCGDIEKLTYRADLGKYIDSHITTAVANALNA